MRLWQGGAGDGFQQIEEFFENERGRQIMSVVGAKLLMGVGPFEAKRMQEPFELSNHFVDMLTRSATARARWN